MKQLFEISNTIQIGRAFIILPDDALSVVQT